ncbi:hypothetical protein Tco_0438052 [Tanacetum coccineum]
MEDPQSSSNSFKSVNATKTCFKSTTNIQKDQLQVKTLMVKEVETPKSKEPGKALEDEFKDLHLNLPVLEVPAHVPIYDALLDKYIKSLEDSKPFDTLADLGSCVNLIPLNLFKKLKIGLLEETEDVLGLVDGTKSYPVGIVKKCRGSRRCPTPYYAKKDFMNIHLPELDGKIALGMHELNPFEDILVYGKMVRLPRKLYSQFKGKYCRSAGRPYCK